MRESEVFLMRNTKWELNPYSFYDTEGLARHFERMAAEGWAPDRVGLFIRYRRIKPQKLRFAITYYPDDGGADGEDVFLEYCAQAGWQQSAGVGDLTFWGDGAEGEGGGLGGRTRHVLCTADENAVDVETDPVLQVDAMHRALKYYHSMMIFWFGYMLLRIWDILTGLKTDPLNTLIYGMGDFLSCISPVVTLICGTDLICYNSWYRKEHRFLPAKSHLWLQILERAALLLTLFGILVRALLGTGGSSMGRLYLAAILCGITPFAAMFLTYSAVKTGAGRAKRCIVTACASVKLPARVRRSDDMQPPQPSARPRSWQSVRTYVPLEQTIFTRYLLQPVCDMNESSGTFISLTLRSTSTPCRASLYIFFPSTERAEYRGAVCF